MIIEVRLPNSEMLPLQDARVIDTRRAIATSRGYRFNIDMYDKDVQTNHIQTFPFEYDTPMCVRISLSPLLQRRRWTRQGGSICPARGLAPLSEHE